MAKPKRIKVVASVLTIFFSCLFLTGCWDRVELEERAVILGISIDKADPEEAKQEEEVTHLENDVQSNALIRIAVQIALPGRIPLGPGKGGGSGSEKAVWVLSVVGHSIDDAIMNLQQQIAGRVFFGHLRVIVVSEDVARIGMQNINDYFRRNSEIRRMAWMMVTKGKAEKLLRAAPKLERVPTLYLISTLDHAIRMGKFPQNYVGMFWSNVSKKGQEGILPYMELEKEGNVLLKGLAYFRADKMVGVTKPLEIAAYMGVKGISPGGYRGYVQLGDPSKTVAVYSTTRKSKIDVKLREGRPQFTVSLFNEINMEEKSNEQFLVDEISTLDLIQKKHADLYKRLIEKLVKDTQEKRADIFGFGEYVRAKEPKYWDTHIGTKERWQDMYKNVSIEIDVTSRMRRVGMKAR